MTKTRSQQVYDLTKAPEKRVRRYAQDPTTHLMHLLQMNRALDPTEDALVLTHTPRKQSAPILDRFCNMSPNKVVKMGDQYETTTPRKRRLHQRSPICTSEGESVLLAPALDTPKKITYHLRNADKIEMPEHDFSVVSNIDIPINYQTLQKHRAYLSTLARHRQTPEPIQTFNGSAHGKLNAAEPEQALPMLHWCHILAQSLKLGTQLPENFLIGTPQANAAMLLFEGLIPTLLHELHEEQGLDSDPTCFLDLEWTYQEDPRLRIGNMLRYRIKNEPGPHPSKFVEKTFDMASPCQTPRSAIVFTQQKLRQEFLIKPKSLVRRVIHLD